jgi:hypothetical protein
MGGRPCAVVAVPLIWCRVRKLVHLAGVAAALFAWLIWPTAPGGACRSRRQRAGGLQRPSDHANHSCLTLAARALDAHNLTWWLADALNLVAALLTRRSQIAAWAAIPIAFAGCELATYFLQALVNHYPTG